MQEIINKLINRKHYNNLLEIDVNNVPPLGNIQINFRKILPYTSEFNETVVYDLICFNGIAEVNNVLDRITFLENSSNFSQTGSIICIGVDYSFAELVTSHKYLHVNYIADLRMCVIDRKWVPRLESVQITTADRFDEMMDYNKYVLLGMAKGEYHDIYDWVSYHLNIGFDKVVLYDNNDVDSDERYDDILKEFIDRGQLDIINIRGAKGVQCYVYNEYYSWKRYKWLAVWDCDEYFTFKDDSQYHTIKEFVDQQEADAYLFPWRCMASRPLDLLDQPLSSWDKELPLDLRRDGHSKVLNCWMKTMYYYKSNFKQLSEHTAVIPTFEEFKILDENYKRVVSQITFINDHNTQVDSPCYLRHYLLKDIDTFFYHKYLRGHAGLDGCAGVDGYIPTAWLQNLNYFTEINKTITSQEQEYLLSKGFRFNFTFRPTIVVSIEVVNTDKYYYDEVCKLVRNLGGYDILFNAIIYHNVSEMTEYVSDRKPGLYSETIYYTYGLDLPKSSVPCNQNDYYGQSPLFLHIGYPTDTPVDEYLQYLRDGILNPANFNQKCRELCFFKQEEYIIYASRNTIKTKDDDFGYSDMVNQECQIVGTTNNHMYIDGNTFITNYQTYILLIGTCYNICTTLPNGYTKEIIDSLEKQEQTPYNFARLIYPIEIHNNIVSV